MIIERTNMKDLVINGAELIAENSSGYSSGNKLVKEIYSYKDKYILATKELTQWSGEKDFYSADIFNNIDELMDSLFEGENIHEFDKQLLSELSCDLIREELV